MFAKLLQFLYGVSVKYNYMICVPQTLIGYAITLLYTHGEAY